MEAFKGGLTMNTYIPEEIELKKYFNEISKYDLLKKKEEQELFKVLHHVFLLLGTSKLVWIAVGEDVDRVSFFKA